MNIDLRLNLSNPLTPPTILEDLLRRKLSEDDRARLYASDDNYIHPLRLIEPLDLPGFSFHDWIRFSRERYAKDRKFEEAKNYNLTKTILRLVMENFSNSVTTLQSNSLHLDVVLIGDYHALAPFVSSITDPQFKIASIEVFWKGFCQDPHEFYDSNAKAQSKDPDLNPYKDGIAEDLSRIVHSISAYDSYLGSRWLVGEDGTGLLNWQNISWIANNNSVKSLLVIGALDRANYLNDDENVVDLYYRLCWGVLASCASTGGAVLKISLPVNKAILGIYSLFSLFFTRVKLIKLKHYAPDDDTVYLIGFGYNPPSYFPPIFGSKDKMEVALEYFASRVSSISNSISSFLEEDLHQWVDQMADSWPGRNN